MPSHKREPRELLESLGRAHMGIVAYRNVLNRLRAYRQQYSDVEFFTAARIDQDLLLGSEPKDIYTFDEIMAQYKEMQWVVGFVKDLEKQIEKAMPYFRFKKPNPEVLGVYERELEHRRFKREESPVEEFKANVKVAEQLYTSSDEFSMGKHEGNTKDEDWSNDDLDELSMERYVNDIKQEDCRNKVAVGVVKQEFKEEDDGSKYSLRRRSIKLESAPEVEESDLDDIKPIKLEAERIRGDFRRPSHFIQEGGQSRYSRRGGQVIFEEEIKQEIKTDMEDVDLDMANDVRVYKEESNRGQEENLYDVHSESGESDVPRDREDEDSEDQEDPDGEEEEAPEETAERLRTQLEVMFRETLPDAASNVSCHRLPSFKYVND
jgi:ribosomal protein L20A (L18A)